MHSGGFLASFRDQHPEWRPKVVAFPADIFSIHHYTIVAEDGGGGENRFWVDPTTGRVSQTLESDFADFILRPHANLFLGQPGRWVVGVLGLVMLFSVGTGLWFHWRRVRRDLLHLGLGQHARNAWGDLHKMWGCGLFRSMS